MTGANISVKDPDSHVRSLGRGGLGAVMGSKKDLNLLRWMLRTGRLISQMRMHSEQLIRLSPKHWLTIL